MQIEPQRQPRRQTQPRGAAPVQGRAERPVVATRAAACDRTGLPSERIKVASVPAATSIDARSSGRGAITSPPPASQADVRASPSAFVCGASVSGA